MAASRRSYRMRTLTLLLSGVLALAVQPGALAGQIAASRSVDRLVADLPRLVTIEDLLFLLAESGEESKDGTQEMPGDLAAVIAQCRILSLVTDSIALQAPDIDRDVPTGFLSARDWSRHPGYRAQAPVPCAAAHLPSTTRRLSDEQPLGP